MPMTRMWVMSAAIPGGGASHSLVVPRRLSATWWEAPRDERHDLFELVDEVKALLDERHGPDGYNVGFNAGAHETSAVSLVQGRISARCRSSPFAQGSRPASIRDSLHSAGAWQGQLEQGAIRATRSVHLAGARSRRSGSHGLLGVPSRSPPSPPGPLAGHRDPPRRGHRRRAPVDLVDEVKELLDERHQPGERLWASTPAPRLVGSSFSCTFQCHQTGETTPAHR